jgi:hypothetical protein
MAIKTIIDVISANGDLETIRADGVNLIGDYVWSSLLLEGNTAKTMVNYHNDKVKRITVLEVLDDVDDDNGNNGNDKSDNKSEGEAPSPEVVNV